MAPPIATLRDIIHEIACRAIRHDLKTPLSHVESFYGLLRETLLRKRALIDETAKPQEVVANAADIPLLAKEIRAVVTDLEQSLNSSAQYSGAMAQQVLKDLIDGKCAELEAKATALRTSFENVDQQCAEYAARIVRNAKAARSRLRSLLSFFKPEYANRSMVNIDLYHQAERAARDTSPSSSYFSRVFRFVGAGDIFGTELLIQSIFQNVYENTIRYGSTTPDLISRTTITTGTFIEIATDIQAVKERPPPNGRWVRIDFANSGPPLSPKNPNSIFQLGKRFEVLGIDDDEGQGLGMAICFAVAILHKGFMWAFPRKGGVWFSVFLPRHGVDGFNDRQLLEIARMMRIA